MLGSHYSRRIKTFVNWVKLSKLSTVWCPVWSEPGVTAVVARLTRSKDVDTGTPESVVNKSMNHISTEETIKIKNVDKSYDRYLLKV